ncbi:hypothetical protein D9613_000836 [Agrocybe pediades]|uniref:C2H2-type domain-containing protein n=1 Tax=Agrocybe pediades TaxID=84607 RepID=A0A8H4VUF0_9AGAR|nr:hypothetical protein D9613_000836 [Agrocybe pediades]
MTLRRISESNPWRSTNYSLRDNHDRDDNDSDYSDDSQPASWANHYNASTRPWPIDPYQPQSSRQSEARSPEPRFDRHKLSNLRTTSIPTPSQAPSRPQVPSSPRPHPYSRATSPSRSRSPGPYYPPPSPVERGRPSDSRWRGTSPPPLSRDHYSSRYSPPNARPEVPTYRRSPPRKSHVSHSYSSLQQTNDHYDDYYYYASRDTYSDTRVRYHGQRDNSETSPPPGHRVRTLRGRDGNTETPHITTAKVSPPNPAPYAPNYARSRPAEEHVPYRVIRGPEPSQLRTQSHLDSITLPPISELDRLPPINALRDSGYGPPSGRDDASRRQNLPPLSKTIQDLFRPTTRDLPRVMHRPYAMRTPPPPSFERQHEASSSRFVQRPVRELHPSEPMNNGNGQRPAASNTVPSAVIQIPEANLENGYKIQSTATTMRNLNDYIPGAEQAEPPQAPSAANAADRPTETATREPSVSSDEPATSIFESDDSSDEYVTDDEAVRKTTRRRPRKSRRLAASKGEPLPEEPDEMAVDEEEEEDASMSAQEADGQSQTDAVKDHTLPVPGPADGRRPKSQQTPWNTQGAPTFKVARQAAGLPPAPPSGTLMKDKGLTWDFSIPEMNDDGSNKEKDGETRKARRRSAASTQRKKAALRQNMERASKTADEDEVDELAEDDDDDFVQVRDSRGPRPKTKKGSFKCPQCTIMFTRNFDMSRHIKTVHETAPEEVLQTRTCPCCFTIPSRRDAFRRHLLRVPMSCNRLAQICGKPQPVIQGSQLEALYEMCRQMDLRVPEVARKHLGLPDYDD